MPWFKRKARFGRWLGREGISKVAVEPATVESSYCTSIGGAAQGINPKNGNSRGLADDGDKIMAIE